MGLWAVKSDDKVLFGKPMRTRLKGVTVVCAAVGAFGSAAAFSQLPAGAPLSAAPTMLASPAGSGAAQPQLTPDARGDRLWLSWLEPVTGGGRRFRLAELQGDTFSTPVTIVEGTNLLANWADVPSVYVTRRGEIVAQWLERGGGGYGIRLRTSRDGGKTWTAPTAPHPLDSPGEHGFVSFFETADGTPGLVWLDGRGAAGHGTAGHGGQAAMALRATTVTNGTPGAELVVDPRVCDCCPTAATQSGDAVLVAYRDRSDEEIRDISVARFARGSWSPPSRVHADNWQINGCPVNGPAIGASGSTVAVAWFTQATNNTPEVRVAFSKDAAQTFGPAVRVNTGATTGRVGLLLPDASRALVSSIERVDGTSSLVVREVSIDGAVGPLTVVGPMSADRSSGMPRLARHRRRAIFAWTATASGAPSQVQVAAAPLR